LAERKRTRGVVAVGAPLAAESVAVLVRQHHVEHHQIGGLVAPGAFSLAAVTNARYCVALGLEVVGQH